MAVIRQENLLGQQRVDLAHLRAIESGVAGDFDVLAGSFMAGRNPLVVNGFVLVTVGIAQAELLQIKVAGSGLIHFFASESGSIFQVPGDRPNEVLGTTNPRLSGGFTPSQVNFIGLDLKRSVDNTTVDLVEFLDPNTNTEDPREVPLARTLDYRIVISTTDFSLTPGILPLAKVVTGPSNNIISTQDARDMMFRLGSGGTDPDPGHFYNWPAGRKEGSTGDSFLGGDKAIDSQKSWMDAIMTRLWETGGGEFWYSPTADRNVKMIRQGLAFISNGEYFEWDGINLHWKGLVFLFDDSTGVFNEVADQLADVPGQTDLADGECIYVDLDRTQNRTVAGLNPLLPVKTSLSLLGQGIPPGSRWILAWRYGSQVFTRDQSFPVNSSQIVATVGSTGNVQLSASEVVFPANPRVALVDSTTFLAIAGGLSRGNAAGPGADFFGGIGDLTIGGGSSDQNIILATTRTQDSTIITGQENYNISNNATLEVINTDDMIVDSFNQIAKFKAFDSSTGLDETALSVESVGMLGFRNVLFDLPTNPAPTPQDPIRSKIFFRTNSQTPGQVPPICRDQLCVIWFDGNVTVISESAPY